MGWLSCGDILLELQLALCVRGHELGHARLGMGSSKNSKNGVHYKINCEFINLTKCQS